MCGIVGAASKYPLSRNLKFVNWRDVMAHRGPDDSGEWCSDDGLVCLAHRRLSIIDLSAFANQPMHDSFFDLTIVFNGEIYNYLDIRDELSARGHSFKTRSDTETILAAYREWGVDCLNHLNGMFAFAIYNKRSKTLLLARDRAGEKPLYYHHDGDVLRFSSELKGLLADSRLPRNVDYDAFDCYLAMGFVPGDRCILQRFKKLRPAHAMLFHLPTGHLQEWRYWSPPELECHIGGHTDDLTLLDELEYLLENAVRRQMVADVPVGVLLSGGVDSSLITAMAVRVSSQVQTFSIGFPGYGSLDESVHARLIANYFGTSHTELTAEQATAELLPRLAKQFDEPMADSSMIPTYLVSQLVRSHCKVALGGDGGDELFGGYRHYSRVLMLQKLLHFMPGLIIKPLSSITASLLPFGSIGRNWIQACSVDLKMELPMLALFFDANIRQKLMARYSGWNLVAESVFKASIPPVHDLLQRTTRMDFSNYLAEDILVKIDRASMLTSLEVRSPMLDYQLVDFAFGRVPSRLKATDTKSKILLKRLAARVLPHEFDLFRKQGFSIPLSEWLKSGPFRRLFYDVLLDPGCTFNRSVVKSLLNGQDHGLRNSERLFSLVIFELWRKEYMVVV